MVQAVDDVEQVFVGHGRVDGQADDVGAALFCLGKGSGCVSRAFLVVGKEVDRGVIDGQFDPLAPCFLDELVTGAGECLGLQEEQEEVQCGFSLGISSNKLDGVEVLEGRFVSEVDFFSAGVHFFQAVHLVDADGGLEVGHVAFVAGVDDVVEGAAFDFHALVGALIETVAGKDADFVGEGFVFAGDHAAFRGGDVFGGVEGEGSGVSE